MLLQLQMTRLSFVETAKQLVCVNPSYLFALQLCVPLNDERNQSLTSVGVPLNEAHNHSCAMGCFQLRVTLNDKRNHLWATGCTSMGCTSIAGSLELKEESNHFGPDGALSFN